MANRRGWLGRSVDGSAKWLLRFRIFRALGKWVVNSRLAWSLVSRIERVRGVRARSRLRGLDSSELPQHISIIMDGIEGLRGLVLWNLDKDTRLERND